VDVDEDVDVDVDVTVEDVEYCLPVVECNCA